MARALRIWAVFLLYGAAFVGRSTAWGGFYTGEYDEYSLSSQRISVVFTLEAPFKVVKKAPLSLSTVLDTSGSLRGRGIELLKSTTQFLLYELAEDAGLHDVGLVAFDSRVKEIAPVAPLTASNAEIFAAAVGALVGSGDTFLAGGLSLGVEQQTTAAYGKIKTVYLFSDGVPNVGAVSIPAVLGEIDKFLSSTDEHISISTFGMGDEIDYALLSAIAAHAGGSTYVIHHPEDIPLAFGKALGGLTTIVGTDIVVNFNTFPGCHIRSVTSGGIYSKPSLSVQFGDLYAGELREILFDVELDVGPVGFEKCLETEYFYVDAVTREKVSGGKFVFEVHRVAKPPPVPVPAPRVEESRLKYLVSDACFEAKNKLEAGDREGALKVLVSVKAKVEASVVDSEVLVSLMVDVEVLIEEVGSVHEADVLKVSSLASYGATLKEGRSVTTRRSGYEIDHEVETTVQKTVRERLVQRVYEDVGVDETSISDDLEGDEEGEEGDEEGDGFTGGTAFGEEEDGEGDGLGGGTTFGEEDTEEEGDGFTDGTAFGEDDEEGDGFSGEGEFGEGEDKEGDGFGGGTVFGEEDGEEEGDGFTGGTAFGEEGDEEGDGFNGEGEFGEDEEEEGLTGRTAFGEEEEDGFGGTTAVRENGEKEENSRAKEKGDPALEAFATEDEEQEDNGRAGSEFGGDGEDEEDGFTVRSAFGEDEEDGFTGEATTRENRRRDQNNKDNEKPDPAFGSFDAEFDNGQEDETEDGDFTTGNVFRGGETDKEEEEEAESDPTGGSFETEEVDEGDDVQVLPLSGTGSRTETEDSKTDFQTFSQTGPTGSGDDDHAEEIGPIRPFQTRTNEQAEVVVASQATPIVESVATGADTGTGVDPAY